MRPNALRNSKQWRYGIVLDAGSSGTRLYVYRWLESLQVRETAHAKQLQSLPVIETKKEWAKKTKPGISTFGEKAARVGPDHLKDLFEKAKEVVPKNAAHDTPIFLLATAGMRLLPKTQREEVLTEVCEYARSTTDFLLPDCDVHIQVIPGDTEGLYGWLAANYLLRGFDAQEDNTHQSQHTFGFLDLGGASAQIAFAPNATEAEKHADDLTLMRLRTVDGKSSEYRVFSATWLRFGANEARARYVEALEKGKESKNAKELLDPCLPPGLEITPRGDVFIPDDKTVDGKIPVIKGTGKFDECLKRTQPLLEKDHVCKDDPCLVAGVHVPAIDFDVNHFVGVSEYWHTTHEIFQVGEKEKAYDFNTYQQRVSNFCKRDWNDIKKDIEKEKWGSKVNEKTVVEVCFKASWLINLLHEGIGVPRVDIEDTGDASKNGTSKLLDGAKDKGFMPAFRPVHKIDDTEVSWTLGKIVLYASSLVEPSDGDALPVGFGSNAPGIPPDFQYPSVQLEQPSSAFNSSLTSSPPIPSKEQHSTTGILRAGSSRRIPGILIFLLMLCFAIYFLLYRTRRNKNHATGSYRNPALGRPSRLDFLAKKAPSLFRSSPGRGTYERVNLEDGGALANPGDFELGGYMDEEGSSDSSGGSRDDARSSGWASPTRSRNGKANSHGGVAGFDSLGSGQGLGIGLVGNAMNRSGLTGRVDSKDQIVGLVVDGQKSSRSGSPARRSASRLGKLLN